MTAENAGIGPQLEDVHSTEYAVLRKGTCPGPDGTEERQYVEIIDNFYHGMRDVICSKFLRGGHCNHGGECRLAARREKPPKLRGDE